MTSWINDMLNLAHSGLDRIDQNSFNLLLNNPPITRAMDDADVAAANSRATSPESCDRHPVRDARGMAPLLEQQSSQSQPKRPRTDRKARSSSPVRGRSMASRGQPDRTDLAQSLQSDKFGAIGLVRALLPRLAWGLPRLEN